MHEHQPNQRSAAARAFMESLKQLQNICPAEPQPAESDFPTECDLSLESETDTKIWEEAGADLDAFFGDLELLQNEMLDQESE